jgi:hypothetical protein
MSTPTPGPAFTIRDRKGAVYQRGSGTLGADPRVRAPQ